MRWQELFDDLEAQLAAQERLELDAEVADRTRAERAKVSLAERLAGSVGELVSCRLRGGLQVVGELTDVGSGWLVIEDSGRPVLVPLAAVLSVSGVLVRPRASVSARRLELGHALRGISRDRRVVHVRDVDGGLVTGTIDRVGADALDLSEHSPDEPRRAGNVRAVRVIPFAAVAAVVSSG